MRGAAGARRLGPARERIPRSTVRSALATFWAETPYGVEAETDSQTGQLIVRLRVIKEIPASISAIVGDALHNLRASLDVLICDFVRTAGNVATPQNALPIAWSARFVLKQSRIREAGQAAAR